jgi:hypothetical protein
MDSIEEIYMRVLVLASVLAAPVAAFGAEIEDCDEGRLDCAPFVACIEETGEYFRGFSLGADAGPLAGKSVTGTICTGEWARGPGGLGVAKFTCDDGRAGSSVYSWFEPESGTAVGTGQFVDGSEVRFWTGSNLERYFREIDPSERERMACQPADMLLS